VGFVTRRKVDIAADAWRAMVDLLQSRKDTFLEIASSLGITPGHVHALLSIDAAQGQPMRTLATAWKCDASNVTFLVDRLEQKGFVERRPSLGDRRVRTVALTESGRSAQEAIRARLYEPPASLLELSVGELELLADVLHRVLESPVTQQTQHG
jgi:DNA-binding MarR family transcriptional regulator